ncbi:response regulator transcription factor [Acidovorax sp. MR-S7]|uniref:response regulator transcription factor n=1 Tax=Acidovorax sp. MR-S7 TaxID=1268622 RepID=UPI0003AAAA27|nr:response regulator transcription factor [Acidovorax sp. MR-S7]GAD22909.1 response regulator [Acidovorax sp. MR-S7]
MLEVILLEDEPVLLKELGRFLDSLGYAPLCLSSVAAFTQMFDARRHRLAVIDIGLPDGSGLALIRRLRQTGEALGIVVYSARSTAYDRIAGLEAGADHYLGKGCDLDELAATLAALERRLALQPLPALDAAPAQPAPWQLELGPAMLHVAGAPLAARVALSPQDSAVLHCLMLRSGATVSRRDIVQALGADYDDYDQRRLDSQMHRLRQRVEDATGCLLPVRTVRGSGFVFYEPAQVR